MNKINSRAEGFVSFIIKRIHSDKGTAAMLRRADNPATEYQCWEHLAAFNIQLDKPYERLPYATIAAAIAKAKIENNGKFGIGRVLADCYDDKCNSEQAKMKLRRILSSDSVEDLCRVLRPLFSFINSRSALILNYADILTDLLYFHGDENRLRVKARWAQDFYNHREKAEIIE